MSAFCLRYDLRAPEWAPTQHAAQYQACLEQVAWADDNGFDVIALTEHHGVDDGFSPAPVTMAAAVAARTKRMMITVGAAVVPLHDPVRLAEQMAIVDLISAGRVSYVLGTGYRDVEFEMAGIDPKQRGRILEEYVGVMRQAWAGEPFEWRGRTIQVRPVPMTKPHPPLFAGGSGPMAARRAARLGLPFLPAVGDEELQQIYYDECAKVGTTGFCLMPSGPGIVHVTEDVEAGWDAIGRYALYEAQTYRSWQRPGQKSQVLSQADTVEDLRKEGVVRVVTPDECVELAEGLGPAGSLIFNPLLCGMPPEVGMESLELFRAKVMPRLRP